MELVGLRNRCWLVNDSVPWAGEELLVCPFIGYVEVIRVMWQDS